MERASRFFAPLKKLKSASINSLETYKLKSLGDEKPTKSYKDIPGPKPILKFFKTFAFQTKWDKYAGLSVEKMMSKLRDDHGEIVLVDGIPGQPAKIYVFDPSLIKSILAAESFAPVRPAVECLARYKALNKKVLGVGDLQGVEWQKFRNTVQPSLKRTPMIEQYIPKIDLVAKEFVDRMKNLRHPDTFELPNTFANELNKWALESIGFVALGHRIGCLTENLPKDSEAQRLIKATERLFEHMSALENRPVWLKYVSAEPILKNFYRDLDEVFSIVEKYAEEAIKNVQREGHDQNPYVCIADSLLRRGVDIQKTSAMLHDTMSVGFSTVANAAGACLYALATNPRAQACLQEELRRVLVKPLSPVTFRDDLPYLRACLTETFRMYPTTIAISRVSEKEVTVAGYRIPKGIPIIMALSVIGKTEKYCPQSDVFLPERWLAGAPSRGKVQRFGNLPFGFGVRNCIGQSLAEWELLILLARVVSKFHLEWHHGPLEVKSDHFNRVDIPLKIKITDR